MKNILKYSMLFVLTVLGLASCTEDYEYSAATAEGQQVYFQSSPLPHARLEHLRGVLTINIVAELVAIINTYRNALTII